MTDELPKLIKRVNHDLETDLLAIFDIYADK